MTSRAVTGSSAIQQARLERERHGDHSALFHAAGKFMWVVHQALGVETDQVEKIDGSAARRPLVVAAAQS